MIRKIQKLMDRGTAMVSASRTLNATLALIKCYTTPSFRVEATGFQNIAIIADRRLAMGTDDAHQSLRQHTIQRRYKIVGFHSHVDKPAQHIDHIVSVHRGEY